MKIQLTTDKSFRKSRSSGKSKTESVKSDSPRSPFQSILDEILPVADLSNLELHELWNRLPGAEKELLEKQTNENLAIYKELVKSIAQSTIKKNIKIMKMVRKSRGGENMELRVIKILDERLKKMVEMMQSQRNSAFQLMRKMDEIRGLLLDMKDDLQ